jgi:hypothetical protein
MKMSLLVVCLIGTGFFEFSTAARAAPFGGGFHRSVQSGRMGGFAGGRSGPFIRRDFHASSAFRHDNHFFFHRQFHRCFPGFNVVAVAPLFWYPNYYPDTDGYLQNDNGSYEPDYNYQYWNGSAARQQSELATLPNNNAPITIVVNTASPQPSPPNYGGSPYVSNGPATQDKRPLPGPNGPTQTTTDPLPLVTVPAKKGDGVDKLVLISWLNDAGKYVIYVKNTETDEMERITSEPNNDQFRIVAIHPNSDAKLFEAVISDGNEQVTVKFPFANPTVAKALTN